MLDNKVPLGKPLPLSDDELDALAEVTEEDIKNAKKLVRKADPKLAEMLEAEAEE